MSLQQRLKLIEAAATTADAVYAVLRQSILDGELPPGQRLLSDALANDFKVSRTPVREALRKLETEGLIEASPRSGLVVRELSEDDLTELFVMREASRVWSPVSRPRMQRKRRSTSFMFCWKRWKRRPRMTT
jgi:DNA-binding GntR family transcriptional regulator